VNGKSFVYHRATGIPLPSNVPENHPRFLAAYLDAERNGKPKSKLERVEKYSVACVAQGFMNSRKFKSLSIGYQNNIRRDIARMCEENNGAISRLEFSSVKRKHIEIQMDNLARNAGNQRLKTWRYLTEYATKMGVVRQRATEGVKANPELNTGGHLPWTIADVEQFRSFWPYGTRQRLAFELQYWAGARISDTRTLGPGNIDADGG
jgi:site-specific recombinase XerC